MAMKIALIAALCIAQGFALKPFFAKENAPCKHPLPASAEVIAHDFEEVMDEMDNVREVVSAAMMESYFKGTDPKVIIACFNQERGNYAKLGQNIANKIRAGAEEVAKDLGDKSEEFIKAISGPIRIIAVTLRTLPQKLSEYIKNQEFRKAFELYKQAKRIVEENAKIISDVIQEFTEGLPETAEKAEKIAQEIREEARKGCEAISASFRKCVEAGGPKPQETEVEVEAELEPENSQ